MEVNIPKVNLMLTVVTNQQTLNIITFTSVDGTTVNIPEFNFMLTV
jgi:hypothetical protein